MEKTVPPKMKNPSIVKKTAKWPLVTALFISRQHHKCRNCVEQNYPEMAIALGEAVALALVDAVVQFAIHGNEKEMQERLLLPSLEAKIWFKDDWIEGHHQGLRALCGRQGSFWCIGPRCYSVEASGHGTFVSEELIYTGIFVNNKLHDLTGNATCSFGSTVRYAGCFEHGHYSGQGTLSQMFNGQWIVTFEGSWKLSKPWCGNYLDISGNVMSTVMDGVIIRLGPEPVGGAAPPADASPANNSRHDANAGKPSPSADQSAGEAGEATAKPKSPAPPQSPSRGTRVHPMPDTAGEMPIPSAFCMLLTYLRVVDANCRYGTGCSCCRWKRK